MAASSFIFSTLEKFSDTSKSSLSEWLNKFDRCCIVAKKADGEEGNVKGQLLLLYVEGRARAILEEYEEAQGGNPLTYAVLAAKLKEHFESASSREEAMKKFEMRMQNVNESEEEFMLGLLKLYSLANPNHAADIKLAAIKRKFINGISEELRRNIFIFCNNPYAAGVTRENLLSHCRDARMHLKSEPAADNPGTDGVMAAGGGGNEDVDDTTAAINNLSLQLQTHVENTGRRLDEFGQCISSMNNNRGGYRPNRGNNNNNRGGSRPNRGNNNNYNNRQGQQQQGGFRGGYQGQQQQQGGFRGGRGGRRGGFQPRNNGGNQNNGGQVRCFRCNGSNHYAWGCTAPRTDSEN